MTDYQSIVPAQDRNVHIFTFQDVVDKLLDLFDLKRTDARAIRLAKEAVLAAYRDLPLRRRWGYFERRATMTTTAPFETGTVVYDHAGGVSERLATFSSTLPSWARWGRLYLDSVFYDIESVIDGTNLTLKQHNNPGADVASTTFTLYRFTYSIPNDVRKITQMFNVTDGYRQPLMFTSQRNIHGQQTLNYVTPDTPWDAYIRGDPDRYGGKTIEFSAASTEAKTYDFTYHALPRPLALEYYGTGKVTTSTTTVTLTGGVFPEDCLGTIIRFSDVANKEPTGVAGNTLGVDNRYYAARVVTERTSDTAVEIDAALGTEVSDARYVLSDPLDLDYDIMLNAFYAMAKAEFADSLRVDDKLLDRYLGQSRNELTKAKESDDRHDGPGVSVLYGRNRGVPDHSENQTLP